MAADKPKHLWDDLEIGDIVTSKGLEPAEGFTEDNPVHGLVIDIKPYHQFADSAPDGFVSILWNNGDLSDYDICMLKDVPSLRYSKLSWGGKPIK